MISTSVLLGLLVAHTIGDFFLQTNWMAMNKGRNWKALLTHTSIWSLCFVWAGWQFMLVNFILHTITDKLSSQLTSRWWFVDLVDRQKWDPTWGNKNLVRFPAHRYFAKVDMWKRARFFEAIGFDQLIHLVTLVLTWSWINA